MRAPPEMTTNLPDGEVKQYEVLEWAQEQAVFLSPTQCHVLWYLCINAWHTPNNPEEAHVGEVLSGRTALRTIQARTGLSQRSVRYALDALQDAGYIWAEHKPGNGQSKIAIFWTADADEMRREFRSGSRDLPEAMRRKVVTKTAPKKHLTVVKDTNIVEFP